MELVKGQNIAIANTSSLVIDVGWRSGATDLHLQAFGIFYPSNNEQGQLIDAQQESPHIIRSADGRRFELDIEQLDQQMDKFAIALVLPSNTKYRFDKVQNLQAFITSGEAGKIATIKLDQQYDTALAIHFIEIYQHRSQWKLKLLAQPLSGDVQSLTTTLNYSLPTHLQLNEAAVEVDVTKQPIPKSHNLRDGVTLSMGESFSLTQQYAHVLQLTYKARCAPALDDITLNALALNTNDKVRNIKDFIYHSNSSLKGGALFLEPIEPSSRHECTINIDFQKLPSDITKICLIATRESDSKRFSSADFIQCKLESTNTSVPICDFTCETAKKNYNCIILLEIYKYKDEWKVKAVGQGYAQGLDAIGEKYGFNAPRIRPMQSSPNNENTVTPNTTQATDNSTNPFSGPAKSNSSTALTQTSAPSQQIANSTGVWGMMLALAGLCIMLSSATLFSQPLIVVLSILAIAAGSYITINARKQEKLKVIEATERFMLNIIKQNNYHITPFEVAARSTLTVQQATTILDVLCDKGAGRLTVSDNGSEVYLFETMQSQQNTNTSQVDTW